MEPWIPGQDVNHTTRGPDTYIPCGMLLTHKDLQSWASHHHRDLDGDNELCSTPQDIPLSTAASKQ